MELPLSLISDSIGEGNIYYFTDKCPVGVPEHMHICVKVGDKVFFFSTCTSQTNTVFKSIQYLGKNPNSFPCIHKDDLNKFHQDLTYVDCNKVFAVSSDKFSQFIANGSVRRLDGELSDGDMKAIVKGVLSSDDIPDDIKDLFRE